MAAPTVQTLAQLMAQYDPAYQQLRRVTQGQIDALPGQEATQVAALDAAKGNAFTDINTNANSKGLAFSGIPVAEQSRYLGEKYLPAVANVKATINQNKTSLQQQLASLYQDQYTKAISQQQAQQSELNSYNQMIERQRLEAQQAAAARAADRAASQAANVSYIRNKAGGYTLINGDGTKNNTLDLAGYVKLNGGGVSDLLNFLSEGDKKDRKAVQNYYNNLKKGYTSSQALAQLKKDRPTAFYKGGSI